MRKGEPHKGKAGGNWHEAQVERRTAEAARARHTNQLRKQWRQEEGVRQRMQMQTRVKQARRPPRATPPRHRRPRPRALVCSPRLAPPLSLGPRTFPGLLREANSNVHPSPDPGPNPDP